MNKKLLIDTINFEVSPQQLQEAQENSDGRLIVQGVLQRATAKIKMEEYIQRISLQGK